MSGEILCGPVEINGCAEAEALVDVLHQHVESLPGQKIQLLSDNKFIDPRASELSCPPGLTVVECIRTPALVDVLHQHVESQPGPRIQLLCDDKLTDPRASELSCHPGPTVVECIRTPCNLYKVSRTDYSMYSWDEYQSFICVAATEHSAHAPRQHVPVG